MLYVLHPQNICEWFNPVFFLIMEVDDLYSDLTVCFCVCVCL